jgi:hypothetical protein
MFEVDVVVEAAVGRRANVELGVGKDALQGCGQYVRTRVAKFFEWSHGHD